MKNKKSAIIFTIFAFVILSLPFHAGAVVNWTKDTANNPVYEPGDGGWDDNEVERPMVVKEGTGYTMWYTGIGSSGCTVYIGRVTTNDATETNWSSGVSVFGPSATGWDSANVGYCWIIKNASGASPYQMWYTGSNVPCDEEMNTQIGHAYSIDGINWTRSGTSPVLEYGSGVSDWDRDGVAAPTVIYDASATTPYKMWYIGFNESFEPGIEAIGYAESQDGITWHKYDNPGTGSDPYAHSDPVIFGGNEGAWDEWLFSPSVIKEGSLYRMWYDGEREIDDQGEELVRIGYAYSLDGITWTKYIGSPVILEGGTGDFDEDGALDPMVIKDGNTYKMWYVGEGNCVAWDCDSAIGYASSPAYPQDAYLGIEYMSVAVYNPGPGTGLLVMMYPAGPGPLDINEAKVEGPGGFSYTFSDSDIQNVYSNNRVHQFPATFTWVPGGPGAVQTGTYTFTLTANSGVSVSDTLTLNSTTPVPIPQDGPGALDRFIDVSGVTYGHQTYINSTTPTFKWKPSSGTTYYYRVMVRDWTTRAIWHVGPYQDGTQVDGNGYMSDTLAAGKLKGNTPYKWQVEALDTNNVWSACARSRSAFYDIYTGTKSGVSDFLMGANVKSEHSTYAGDKGLPIAVVHNLAPWDIDTTTGGQEFRVEKSGGTPFSYLFDINNSAPVENDCITFGANNVPFFYLPAGTQQNNFPRYFLPGFPEDGTYDFIVYENGTFNHETLAYDFTRGPDLPIVERSDMSPQDNAYLGSNEPNLTWISAGRWKWHRVMIVDWTLRRIAYVSEYMDGVDAGQFMSLTIPPGVLEQYSPYRWIVEVYDENRQNRTRGSWLSFVTGEQAYHPGDELVVDFGGSGLWHFGGGWTNISALNSELLENYGNTLAADFGATYGLWTYDSSWTKISALDAELLEDFGNSLAGDFGATYGLWIYDGTWTRISALDAELLEDFGNSLAADFGATYGLWIYDGNWTRISVLDAQVLEEYGNTLAADFGATYGLWIYDGGWTNISALDAEQMQYFGNTLAVDFGATYGLWIYDGSWTKISSLDAVLLEDYDGILAADFGPFWGLWIYDGTWTKIPGSSEDICAYGGNLAGDFGIMGLWSYDGVSWSKINDNNADNTGDTMIDFNLQ
jgi:predicted GH43/DUF377 family glycosyl hydrolase